MSTIRSVFPVLFILIFSSWSSVVVASDEGYEESLSIISNEFISESQWSQLFSVSESVYDVKNFSGLIYSPFGDFDPLHDPIPLGPENLYDLSAIHRTGLVIIQSKSVDMTGLMQLLYSHDLPIIDTLPDSALIVRLPTDDILGSISLLEKSEYVRWIGELPIAWRVSQELVDLSGRGGIILDLDIIPASDIDSNELLELEMNLKMLSDDSVSRKICDAFLCQIKNIDASWIPVLAMDGRILSIHSSSVITVHNDNAKQLIGADFVLDNYPFLNGSGEILAISDTGLDDDQGDFNGRIRGIYNQFGPDNSHQDRNSGHGTHVTSTLLGDGSGESFTQGIVPAATFHFYQLEADSSGILARWGSLYEMFSHSYQQNARIQTNSWGNVNLVGEYSSDSRSTDSYLVDQPSFLVLFSAGDLGENGYESITPPGTAKNVLTIGSSTTGSYGSPSAGSVSSTSSIGTTLDGRIKPDLVAPGVMICSARANEAQFTDGESCSSSTHSDTGNPLYMTLNGSSMSTAVAAGAATMVRQHLRETQSIVEPRSDLIRALLINGADDLGAPDIPNSMEGWGQVNVSQTIFPTSFNEDLNILYDTSRELKPGHSFVYTIESDSTSKFDITLVWNDREGSAVANQSAPKLVNDLDLIVKSPSGEIYYGNNFINGFSAIGGSSDELNNVERFKSALPEVGTWSVEVGHSGGYLQEYAIVLTGDILETVLPDLTVLANSLSTSVESPLQGDTFLIEAQWKNQAAGPSGDYSILIEDITDGNIILEQEKTSLSGGSLVSLSYPHVFSTTGLHKIKITLDSNSEVLELNDELNGINNNNFEMDVYVSQVGVRLTPLLADGSLPSNPSENDLSRLRIMDPTITNSVSFVFELKNEGTSEITVEISASPVQLLGDGGLLMAPKDEWWKLFNESGPWILSPSGELGDSVLISLEFSDVDADIENDIYALPGTFASQVTLWDKNAPTVSHSMQLRTVVERVEGLVTVVAGADDLGAIPGQFAQFSLSILNTGNGPTQYTISCETENRWIIKVGDSGTSVLNLEPLSRLQFLPIPIRVRVPNDVLGSPSSGTIEEVSCTTQSVNDPNLFTVDDALLEVFENRDFSTEIFSDIGESLGPLGLAKDRSVLNGDLVTTNLVITNEGNVLSQFTVKVQNSWQTQLIHNGDEFINQDINVDISAGNSVTVVINTIVPLSSNMGDSNTIIIRTTLQDSETLINGTKLIIEEYASLDIESSEIIEVALGQSSISLIKLHNVGNVALGITLTMGSLPNDWSGGFLSGNSFEVDMNREAYISVGLNLPGALPVGELSQKLSVIIEFTTPGGEVSFQTVELTVEVIPSIWIILDSEVLFIEEISYEETAIFEVKVTNLGNIVADANVIISQLNDWNVVLNEPLLEDILPGGFKVLEVSVKPKESSDYGLSTIELSANATDFSSENVEITNATLKLQMSKERVTNSGGLSGLIESIGLPAWTLSLLFVISLVGVSVLGIRMRNNSQKLMSPEEELIPEGSALLSGSSTERRNAALDTSLGSGDTMTGGVSEDEIQAALASSTPAKLIISPEGSAPLPLTGLPDGWTMEQWQSYGHLWWEQNQP
ncbi:S8 family serine peptidase [Euryarchaeota archaeon]|nr:S8 family serine peptidase [Euryarchaeota archaeon]